MQHGRRSIELDDQLGAKAQCLGHRLRTLKQKESGVRAGIPLRELGDPANPRGPRIVDHAFSLFDRRATGRPGAHNKVYTRALGLWRLHRNRATPAPTKLGFVGH